MKAENEATTTNMKDFSSQGDAANVLTTFVPVFAIKADAPPASIASVLINRIDNLHTMVSMVAMSEQEVARTEEFAGAISDQLDEIVALARVLSEQLNRAAKESSHG